MTQEEKLNEISNRRFKTDYKHLGSEYGRLVVLIDYATELESAISMYVKRELEYKRFATHQQNEIDDLKFGIGIGNQGVEDLKERHVKEIQELRKRCEDLEAENGTMAESIGEFNELIEVFGKVWQAFPDEVLNDQLNEDYHQCSEFYDRYFEDEGHEF